MKNKNILALTILLSIFISLLGCNSGGKSAKDAFGVKTTPDVNINLMSITPSNKSLFVGESILFAASGGNGPYTFSIDSGIGAVTASGFYTAPSFAGTSVVKATDSLGEEAFATINIALKISISPTSATINEGDTLSLAGSGGIPPYTFSIVAGDGSINSATGLFDATGVSSGSAVIEVRDTASNSAFAAITINPSLIITPQTQTIGFGEQIAFSATGGDFPYTYSILTGGGSINSSTGLFVGPSAIGTTVVRVTDASNNSVDSIVTIVDSPQIDRPTNKIAIGKQVTFTSTNGSPPYTYSVVSGGGSIHPTTGVFTAHTDATTTVIQVTDINSYTDSTSIETFVPNKITAGYGNTCAILFSNASTSETKCWGRSSYGIGNGGHVGPESDYFLTDDSSELGNNLTPVDLGSGIQARGVKVGRYSSCAVTTDNRMKCFGYNNYGQLGQGDRNNRGDFYGSMGNSLPFVDLGTGRTVNSVLDFDDVLSINYHSVCVILDNNSAKCWGISSNGKLGYGNGNTIGDGGTEVGDGIATLNFGGDTPVQISVGERHVCAVLNTGEAKCWGNGGNGRLGTESTANLAVTPSAVSPIDLGTGHTAQKISAGLNHTCALLDDGNIKCWGRNNYGQLGIGSTNDTGDNASEMGDNLPYVDLGTGRTAKDIEVQGYSSCAILDTDEVKCWGYNAYGNLGIGSTATIGDIPAEMGDVLPIVNLGSGRTAVKLYGGLYQMCAKLDNGDVKCWGRNNTAQLAQGHLYDIGESALSMGDNLDPIDLSSTASILNIQTNEYSGCAVLTDNSLKCWGADFYGSRGTASSIIGDDPLDMGANLASLDLGSNSDFKDIKGYNQVLCAQNTANQLACWAYAGEGARGSGNTQNRGYLASHWGDNLEFIDFGTGRSVKTFGVGFRGGCAILDNDSVACWGRNDHGNGGVATTADRGDALGEVGDNFLLTDLGNVSTPVEISRGQNNACARFANGGVKCWGHGAYGQNGVGNSATLGDGGGEMGNSLAFINLGTGRTASQICSGENYNCALLDNNQIKCWGRNQVGQLGIGNTNDRGTSAAHMGDNLIAVDLGSGRSAQKVSCGRSHVCALMDNDQIKCWGNGANGRLGQGSTQTIGNVGGEMGDNLIPVNLGTNKSAIDIVSGESHSCAVLNDNSIKCWGGNIRGQLGLGHTTDIGTLSVTLGDALPEVDIE